MIADTAKTIVGRFAGRIADWCADQHTLREWPEDHVVITLQLPQPDPATQTAMVPAKRKPKNASREHVSLFLRDNISPSDCGVVSMKALYARYPAFSDAVGHRLTDDELIKQIKDIFGLIGLRCEARGRDVIVRGARLT